MSTEIVEAPGGELVEAVPEERMTVRAIMQIIHSVALNPDLPVDKLLAVQDFMERVERREAEKEFHQAMARLQARMPRISKTRIIPGNDGSARTRFAAIEDLDFHVRPLLADEGFSIAWDTLDPSPTQMTVIGVLSHRMGHSIEKRLTVTKSTPPRASVTQGDGSTLSYGKRQVFKMLLNIVEVGEDNDGAAAAHRISTPDQLNQIDEMIEQTGADRAKFLGFFRVENPSKLTFDQAKEALRLLSKKRAEATK